MTILDDIKASNDSYHKAIDEAFGDETLPTNTKAQMGEIANIIFNKMKILNNLLESHYNPPTPELIVPEPV